MTDFDAELSQRLNAISRQGLYRELRRTDSPQGTRITIDGKTLLNFSSNDYLGLANHPTIKAAAIEATEKHGAGSGASRLICGSLSPHHELEETIASFKGTLAALSFSSGYATAIGTIAALLGKDDVVIIDKLVHACVVDAARLCGAKLRVFAHNDLNDLEQKLKWADVNRNSATGIPNKQRVLIVTESVFSMDGDLAPLREIVTLKEEHGAWLMLDEAHATGLYGKNRRGLAEECGVANQIEIQMGTLGKAVGASGGYICGSQKLIDLLVNRARSFIFSTAPVPAAAAAASAGIRLVQSAEGEKRNRAAWDTANLLRRSAESAGLGIGSPDSLILSIHIGDETKAVSGATKLRNHGLFVPAIRYPTVARGSARLRVTVTADHKSADVSTLVAALAEIVNRKT